MISVQSGEEDKEQFPDPPSILTTYSPPDEIEETEPAKETPAPTIKKIIITKTEQIVTDCNNTDMSAYPEYANDAASNPYLRTGIPKHLEGKVNSLSQPRPMERRQYTEEEMDAIFEKDYQSAIREEGVSCTCPPKNAKVPLMKNTCKAWACHHNLPGMSRRNNL